MLAGELWHFTQPFTNGNAVGNLWALSYAVRSNLIFDVAIDKGLTSSFYAMGGARGVHLSASPSALEVTQMMIQD